MLLLRLVISFGLFVNKKVCRHEGTITVAGQYVQYWSVYSVLISIFSTCPVCRESLFPGAPGLVDAPPRIRAVRLESLSRARRGGPPHPARKLIRFAIADNCCTHKTNSPLLVVRRCAGLHYSLAVFSWCSQAITSMLRNLPQAQHIFVFVYKFDYCCRIV